ncbi:C25 family cysteine peptidase [candidate division WOR-3 bacterium]|nr:C25 family cysteine peptidase [candidate division WOR-3 bacterium]
MSHLGLLFLLTSLIEINIPTQDYINRDGKIWMEGFGNIHSLPVRVFPIILSPSVEISHIEIETFPEEVKGFQPTFSRYAIQRYPLQFLDEEASLPTSAAVILRPRKIGERLVYPLIINPFYIDSDRLVHTPFIKVKLDYFSPEIDLMEPTGNRVLAILTTNSIEPLISGFVSKKRGMGYSVSLITVPPGLGPLEIQRLLKESYIESPFSYLLIIGDDKTIPRFYLRGISTDFYYGRLFWDKEQGFCPYREVAVGRIPTSQPEEVKSALLRSVLYEMEENRKIVFSCAYDMVPPQIVKRIDALFEGFRVDYERVEDIDYSISIEHTLRGDADVGDGMVITTTAYSLDTLYRRYGDKVVSIVAPASESYFIPTEEGGTSIFLYHILRNFLTGDMLIGEALRKGAIDYWTQYPDSFTEKNILSFQLFGDPTLSIQSLMSDVGIENLPIPPRLAPGTTLYPSVILRGYGDISSIGGKLTVEIEENGMIIYSETVDIAEILPGEIRRVEFQGVRLREGDFLVRVASIFPVDINPSNDTMEKRIIASSLIPTVISTDTVYGKWFVNLLGEAVLSTEFREEVRNSFLLSPYLAPQHLKGENIYIEGFEPDREYSGTIEGVSSFKGVSFIYSGGLATTLPHWLLELSVAMVDREENPVAFYSDSLFVFMGRAEGLLAPSDFLRIITSGFNREEDTLAILFESSPNPSRGETAILFEVPYDNAHITLSIYNIVGNLSRVLMDKQLSRGIYSYIFDGVDGDGRELVSGTYFINLSIAGRVFSKRLIIIR